MYTINNNLEKEHMGDFVVLFNKEDQCSYVLNETASLIYDVIEKSSDISDIDAIAIKIAQNFDADIDICRNDIFLLIHELQNNNIVLITNN